MAETFQEYTNRLLSLSAGSDPLQILASTASRIGTSIAGIGRDDLRARPSPDRWSIAQIVAHLSDAEIVHAYRVRMILAAPGTPIQAYDQNDWSRAQHSEEADAHESVALFAALRASMVHLYRRLTDEELDRYGVHAERGKESVRQLMRLHAGHDRNHLAEIERLSVERRRDAAAFAPAAVKPEVGHATLEAVDVRLGTIRAAVAVAGTDRLAALTVDFGDHSRTIVAGIRTERASLGGVVGAQALFAINLAPRRIRGQLSEGMLFDIGFADGLRPAFAQPEWPLPDGVRAG